MPVRATSRFPDAADGVIPESYSHFVDPFVISVHGQRADRDLIARLHEAGATHVIVRPEAVKTEAEMAAQLERIAGAVLR